MGASPSLSLPSRTRAQFVWPAAKLVEPDSPASCYSADQTSLRRVRLPRPYAARKRGRSG
jgi:hypothetical protein